MNNIIACDPGTRESAIVILEDGNISDLAYLKNTDAVGWIRCQKGVFAFEMVASYGMPVGASTFETVLWSGRFAEAAYELCEVRKVYRKDIKMHLCHSLRAKDSNIRQALIDKLGPVGTKNHQGPCYGMKSHMWAALAVAIYAHECPDGGERI